MPQQTWKTVGSGLFATRSNWTHNSVPDSKDGAVLANTGVSYTVTVSTTGLVINDLQGVAANTLLISSPDTFTVINGTGGGAFAGAIDVAAGATLALGAANTASVTFNNTGAIDLAGFGSASSLRILASGATLTGGGTVTMGGNVARILGSNSKATLTNVDNTISGVGFIGVGSLTLTNDAAGVIDASTKGNLNVNTKGAVLTNAGLMEAAGGVLVLSPTTINNVGGTISAATGMHVDLEDDVIEGGALTSAGTGALNVNVAGGAFDGSSTAVTVSGLVQVLSGTNLTLNGAIVDTGKINTFAGGGHTTLFIGAAGVTLTGGGQINLSDSAGNTVVGLSASDTLTNNDHIDGAGQLGNGALTLVNAASGLIIGNQKHALTINTGANVINNAGLIENNGAGGTLIESAINNTGTLLAATAGTLTVAGSITGTGNSRINGGTLFLEQATAENVTFSGTTGVLKLGDSQAYTGAVTGLSTKGTDWLDLSDIVIGSKTKATYSGTTSSGTLTVTDGTHTANITLIGDYTTATFTVSGDGHGGTKVVDPQPTAVHAAHVASAMAAFIRGDHAGAGASHAMLPPNQHLMLAVCAR